MRLWQPHQLAVPPRLWASARAATWSGTALSAIPNLGSVGGAFTINGSPDKGATLNGVDGVRIDASGESLGLALGAFNNGGCYLFSLLRHATTDTASNQSVITASWGDGGEGIVTFSNLAAGPGNTLSSGNGAAGYSGGAGPAEIVANPFAGDATNPYTIGFLLDATTSTLINGEARATTYLDNPGALPAFSAHTWLIGNSLIGEHANATFWEAVVLDYTPTTDTIERLAGWASWAYFGDGSLLPTGHTFKSTPPTAGRAPRHSQWL